MALNEIQLPSKSEFYANLQSLATSMARLMDEWRGAADFIEDIQTTDLDAMGVGTGQVRTDLTDLRTILNEMHDFFTGVSTSQTKAPKNIIDKIRRMK